MTVNNKPIPIRISQWGLMTEIIYRCPECGTQFNIFGNKEKFCHSCGLQIDWESVPKYISNEQKQALDFARKQYEYIHHDFSRYKTVVNDVLFEVYKGYQRESSTCKKEKKISFDEFEAKMADIFKNEDTETAHMNADELMCEVLKMVGYSKGVKVFTENEKWYS